MRDPSLMYSTGSALALYNECRKWFLLVSVITTPITLVINAPFGRFTPKNQNSRLLLDGITAWIFMELISPLTFCYTFYNSPLSAQRPPLQMPASSSRHSILAACFLAHYANRAILNPLRTPSRSKTHIIVPLSGISFNVINGGLMGSYLSSPFARMFLQGISSTTFNIGLGLWALGLLGNIYHDEILLNIRRKAQAKKGKEHYAIPQGALYKYISYPNYFCEWIEWLGFAMASSPVPFSLSSISLSSLSALFSLQTYTDITNTPAQLFAPSLSPPWIFFITEILLMLPRAYRGHQWYHKTFPAYPKERKAVIPFLL
ncbi:3-oxo-5-alpha-steroid 4-dehydrogenase-domain-containing protein [Panaeolus papilionaceus]|nr:3-oxo-5-alpha-steroid 4-dehydrogenase-domain-containing protein [Panaeolus papilionaceus]